MYMYIYTHSGYVQGTCILTKYTGESAHEKVIAPHTNESQHFLKMELYIDA